MDFDQTLISTHSGGRWKDSMDKLVKEVRPCMRDLISASLDKGIYVGVRNIIHITKGNDKFFTVIYSCYVSDCTVWWVPLCGQSGQTGKYI
jgi:hypothetical protein